MSFDPLTGVEKRGLHDTFPANNQGQLAQIDAYKIYQEEGHAILCPWKSFDDE